MADAFTLARMTRGAAPPRAATSRRPPCRSRRSCPPTAQTPAAARRLLRTGVSLDCGQTPILQSSRRSEQCVSYDDGSRVFLWRDGDRWFVVGFTLP